MRLSPQPRPGSATCCGATTAGATAPSRARRRPVPPEPRGCTATPACSWRASLPLALGSDGLHPGMLGPGGRGRAAAHAPRGARRAACLLRRPGGRGRPLDAPRARRPLPRPAALGMTAMRLSAAVCTRDRPHPPRSARSIRCCARRLPPAEILVVDNAPGRRRGPRAGRRPVPLGALRGASRSPASTSPATARWSRRGGEVVAFLDDDAVADAGWAGALLARLRRRTLVSRCAPGGSSRWALDTPGERLFEANGGFSRGLERIRLPDDAGRPLHGRPAPLIAWAISVGSGCSYAVRREPALALGGFDEALDLGTPLPGGRRPRLSLAGAPGRALGGVRAARRSPGTSTGPRPPRRATRSSATSARCRLPGQAPGGGPTCGGRRSLGYTGWRLAKPGVRLLRRALGRDPLPAPVLLRMWWNCWAGLMAYPRARRLARAAPGGGTPHDRASLGRIETGVWRYRELLHSLVVRNLKVKYQRSLLGFVWTLVNPLFTVAVLGVVFSHVVRIPLPALLGLPAERLLRLELHAPDAQHRHLHLLPSTRGSPAASRSPARSWSSAPPARG